MFVNCRLHRRLRYEGMEDRLTRRHYWSLPMAAKCGGEGRDGGSVPVLMHPGREQSKRCATDHRYTPEKETCFPLK